jgi:hypothetical protein
MSRPFRIRQYSVRFAGRGGSVAQQTELASGERSPKSELSRRLVRRIVHGLPQLGKGLQEFRLVNHDQLRVRDETHSIFRSGEDRLKLWNVPTVKQIDARHRFPPFAKSGTESSSGSFRRPPIVSVNY